MAQRIQSLEERCEFVFKNIIKGNITAEMIANVFRKLKLANLNYSDLKNTLLRAGDLEPNIPSNVYFREEICRLFNWSDRTFRDNMRKWELELLPYYSKDLIEDVAQQNGWRFRDGRWVPPKKRWSIKRQLSNISTVVGMIGKSYTTL